MKILRIVPSMNPKAGGVAEAIKQSAVLMKEESITIDALSFDDKSSSWIINSELQIYAMGKGFSKYAFNLNYIKWLFKHAKNYDLIIIDGLWMFHVIGGYICKYLKVPYLIFSHGMLDPYFNLNKAKYIKKLPFWFLVERNIISMAESIVFTCEDEKELAKNSFPLFKANTFVATLGIKGNENSKDFLKKEFFDSFPKLINKRIGIYLSRVHEKKGLELLIESVLINKNIIPKDFIFVIAGTGDINYIKKLKEKIKNLNLDNYFTWVGMLSGDIKWGAYTSAEFFILPSHQENFGIVVAEALSQSTIVLTTNKVNICKEIENYNAGFIEEDTIGGISNLLNQYFILNEKSQMENNAYNCFNEKFSTKAFKRDFIKLIKEYK